MSDVARVAVVGAGGRMGRELLAAIDRDPCLELGVAVDANDGPAATEMATCDVIVDFSSPAGFSNAVAAARASRLPLVSGTTGLRDEHLAALDAAAAEIPLMWQANYSVGVHVLAHLTELAARSMPDFDIEILEAHHRHKVDAPSGTALMLGEAAGRGRDGATNNVYSRHGNTGPRKSHDVGFQVIRGGSIVGEHTVFFCSDGERIELTHRAQDRKIFALGALRAAKWLLGHEPGRYTMKQMLFGESPDTSVFHD